MAATGYTPISLYYSATAAAVPTAANLVPGELALNNNDGKLYYEDSAGAVQVIASKATGSVPGSTTQVVYNNAGALAGSANLIFNGTTLTANTIGAFTLSGTVAGGGNQINNVIIGTTTPLAGFFTTASATTSVTTPSVTNAGTLALSATSTNIITASTNGSERMRVDSSGNVDIGTTSNAVFDASGAARPLVVQKSDTSTTLGGSLAAIAIVNGDTTTSNTAQLNFAAITGASASQYSSAWISCIFGARTNTQYPTGQLVFATSTTLNSAPSEKMRIDSSGNVGIGTNAPGSALDVKGTLRLSGSTSGYVGLAPAAAAGSTTYTLPAADGSSGQYLSTNGSATLSWASPSSSSPIPTMVVYTTGTSATFTIPTGITKVRITVIGGGGTSPNPGPGHVCSGGGSGGTAIKILTGLTPGNTLTYTVGGSAASSQVASGTQTITTISATAGSAGAVDGVGGAGGIGSNGDLNIRGSAGGGSAPTDGVGGEGGSSYLGGGSAAGVAGGAYGGGAGAGDSATGGKAGGAGVVIFEY